MTLRDQLDALTSALCKKAQDKDTPIEASTDALKAAASYYAIREKVKAKSEGEEDGSDADFNQFAGAIHGSRSTEQPHGRPSQPPASRRRTS